VAVSGAVAAPVELVSPVGVSGDPCPTFSWSVMSGAAGYELVIYGVSESGEVGTEPVRSVRLPGGAAAWTPPGTSCLAAGGRYAWTLRVLGAKGTGAWSEPALFEVAAAPSLGDVEAAIATLRRYLADSRRGGMGPAEVTAGELPDGDQLAPARGRPLTPRSGAQAQVRESLALRPQPEKDLESVTAAAVPTLGSPSLTVDANVALGAASNLFKEGSVFLWDDTTGNTAVGRLALSSATGTADHNTAVGREALRYTVQGALSSYGSYNTAVGDRALRSNTTGELNTASGYRALGSNTTGSGNTASGYRALFSNTTGYSNTASGARALFSNTTGTRNTADGAGALLSNTTGFHNTASGAGALVSNTTGYQNTASGTGALRSNTTGTLNTASGFFALYSNTTGSHNTASGHRALYSNTTGYRNTASGHRALFANTTGFRNTAGGVYALRSNTTGAINTASGYKALYSNNGDRNTAVGYRAGFNATSGSDNIFLGAGASGVAGEGNTIRIGGTTGVAPGAQNRAFIAGIRGITTATNDAISVVIDSAGQLGTLSSSLAVKQDIQEIGELSRRLLALRPVAFRYRQHVAVDPETPLQFGLVAEEVAEVFPELVVRDGEGQPEAVKYHLLAALLLNELQLAERELGAATRELAQQRSELDSLRDRVGAVERGRPPKQRATPWWRRLGADRDGP
jgi:hypothetical protein